MQIRSAAREGIRLCVSGARSSDEAAVEKCVRRDSRTCTEWNTPAQTFLATDARSPGARRDANAGKKPSPSPPPEMSHVRWWTLTSWFCVLCTWMRGSLLMDHYSLSPCPLLPLSRCRTIATRRRPRRLQTTKTTQRRCHPPRGYSLATAKRNKNGPTEAHTESISATTRALRTQTRIHPSETQAHSNVAQ